MYFRVKNSFINNIHIVTLKKNKKRIACNYIFPNVYTILHNENSVQKLH